MRSFTVFLYNSSLKCFFIHQNPFRIKEVVAFLLRKIKVLSNLRSKFSKEYSALNARLFHLRRWKLVLKCIMLYRKSPKFFIKSHAKKKKKKSMITYCYTSQISRKLIFWHFPITFSCLCCSFYIHNHYASHTTQKYIYI